MSDISTALAPILVLILLGYALKRVKFLPEDTWAGLEKLTYFIFQNASQNYAL
jgi:malonate transporter and related proteins